MKPFEELHAAWHRHGYETGRSSLLHAPLADSGYAFPTEDFVDSISREFGVVLPSDFRDHLLNMPLTNDGVYGDDEMILFWSADAVIERNQKRIKKYGRPTRLRFCDYLISCWEWEIECALGPDHGRISWNGPTDEAFVFNSFAEAVDAYVRDPSEYAERWTVRGVIR